MAPGDLPESVAQPEGDPLDVTIPGSAMAEIERAAILKSLMAVGGKVKESAAMLRAEQDLLSPPRLRRRGVSYNDAFLWTHQD